ncbi:hypothetical protein TWF506_008080 [Arthrobotrys conoides]|uniref:Secreted protein n=1 Tax=Arthrobotrys conoides TaxID=74498 RepID=A0AAN8N5C2_9PEZI
MSTVVLAAAALLVLYGGSELALETCTSASEISNSTSEPGEEMETISHNTGSIRMQRRHSSIALIGCFFPTRSNGSSTRSFGSFRRKRRETSTTGADKDKPKYVHIPQHAADSHARTTTPLPFAMRPLSQDFTPQPVRTPGPIPFGMRPMSSEITIQPATLNAHFMEQEHAKKVASQGGRVHIVGSVAS